MNLSCSENAYCSHQIVKVTVTDIYTPNGNYIHKEYKIQVDELSSQFFRYISKFPVPAETRMLIRVLFEDRKLWFWTKVFLSVKLSEGTYRVYCAISDDRPYPANTGLQQLFAYGENSVNH